MFYAALEFNRAGPIEFSSYGLDLRGKTVQIMMIRDGRSMAPTVVEKLNEKWKVYENVWTGVAESETVTVRIPEEPLTRNCMTLLARSLCSRYPRQVNSNRVGGSIGFAVSRTNETFSVESAVLDGEIAVLTSVADPYFVISFAGDAALARLNFVVSRERADGIRVATINTSI